VLSGLETLLCRGYVHCNVLNKETAEYYYRPPTRRAEAGEEHRLHAYFEEHGLVPWLSKSQLKKGTRHAVIQPLYFSTEGLSGKLLKLQDLILNYFPHTLRRAIQRQNSYTLYRMAEHHFVTEEPGELDATIPDVFKRWTGRVPRAEGGESLSVEFGLLHPNCNYLSPEQLFTQLSSREGSSLLGKTFEQLVHQYKLLEYSPHSGRISLTAAGYAVGHFMTKAYPIHTHMRHLRYLDSVIYALKRGQKDRLFFLHSWYQSFREEHESALRRLRAPGA
jgi:hypothetical protein